MLRSRINNEQLKDLVLTIDHKDPKIRLTAKRVTKTGESTDSFDAVTDGSEQAATVGGQPVTVKAYWDNWKPNHLIIERKRGGETFMRREYMAGDKGKILTTIIKIKDGSGEKTAYEFFVKE